MSKWLLIDGFNLAYRCFFAIPELTRADGFPTNALHGWIKSIWRLIDQERPGGTLVFFDLGGSQDRLALHPEYKAQREEMPDALAKQIPHLKTLSRAMGLAVIEQNGVESDDLLAAQAVAFANAGDDALIVSSDKDFAQIVNDRIKILLPPPTGNARLGWRKLDAAGVVEKFGVPPSQIADYLALVGDASDNIPGLKGVGPKTAVKWLQQHSGLEAIIAAADTIAPERFRDALRANTDLLRLNLKLVTLNLALPVLDTATAKQNQEPCRAELLAFLEEMGMKTARTEAENRYSGQIELF
ncbi:DNA polymerase-1 [Ereboglobus sp. PH5-5]|uniref:5'-3' exonuclease n=1 Tax=Ereboglobus sp. PH5-5 TaxID=2940529 RepID=UPI002405FA75|nr:5'-3' exonuclease H3TH domain-containing protein [Ereboglobus sp. PH5-5]MDF9834158.1 DNA polymerase-1 [Ereboglobus sp. PH5-5]